MVKNYLKIIPFFISTVLFSFNTKAQSYVPAVETSNPENHFTAVKAKTIYVSANKSLNNGTILYRKGKVVAVGEKLSLPENTKVIDYGEHIIYPGFIELYSNYSTASVQPKRKEQKDRTTAEAYYWNAAIRPETNPLDFFEQNPKQSKQMLSNGFTYANVFVPEGILRGKTAVVKVDSTASVRNSIVKNDVAWAMAFKKGRTGASYPSSLTGAIALIRQFYYDAAYAKLAKESDLGIDAFLQHENLPAIFEVVDIWDVLRAQKIAEEFGKKYHYALTGIEYERMDVLKQVSKKGAGFILPLNFPDAYDIQGPYESDEVSLQQLLRWQQQPFMAAMLAEADIPFALSQKDLKKQSDFLKLLRKAVENGLPASKALAALTDEPAKMLGIGTIGNLNAESEASFLVASKCIFTENGEILDAFVQGKKFTVNNALSTPKGNFNLNIDGTLYTLNLQEKNKKAEAEISFDSLKTKATILLEDFVVSLSFISPKDSLFYSLSGQLYAGGSIWEGKGFSSAKSGFNWAAVHNLEKKNTSKKNKDGDKEITKPFPVLYPNKAYGLSEPLTENNYLIRNATLWTCDTDSILTETDILILKGKIAAIGKKIPDQFEKGNPIPLKIIDARGKVVTPGIIDEHSHIALTRGVNEGAQYISSEVSMAHVVNPEDVNIYRHLAGGVTGAQLLHGSANPIGGQSAIVKMKWGVSAEEMLIPDAPGFIKFALGENVKQSGWGDRSNPRYPQTRMGVEQVYYDAFYRAKAYREAKVLGEGRPNVLDRVRGSAKNQKPFRTDLELEALVEILEGTRNISCHSYVQSEINMLMRVADSMGFKVRTFTHVLEGYKIPERLKEHGASASTFSDWWAYKFEVNDAIPHNAAILAIAGVNTCINSDDAEMGRRLYMEAAKSQMYGGLDGYEAFKMVTINPAKALKIDHRTGSLKVGKDADLVIWSGPPNSIYTRVEKTFVEGVNYYSQNQDKAARESISKLRLELITQMLQEINKGAKAIPVKRLPELHIHCDHMEHYE
ncbi:MAG: amidohydrolase family protein [Luteibaculaceae bacterium]